MTPQELIQSSERCTEVALRALGIDGIVPKTRSGSLNVLIKNGYKLERLRLLEGKTLRDAYIFFDMNASYLIATKGHQLACINGVFFDSALLSNSAKIENIWRVSK
jgi:hypothetical protein